MANTILITGANRGLGLEFCKQYAADGWHVLATSRNPSEANELLELADKYAKLINIYSLDVTDADSIDNLAQQLSDINIDILMNNAGIYGPKGLAFEQLNQDDWLQVLKTNTISPLMVSKAFLPHVQRSGSKIIATITSKMGSITDNEYGKSYIYRSSKAGLNASLRSLSIDFREQGIKVAIIHPGWVQTDMGGPDALISPHESIAGIKTLLANLTIEDSGEFFAYNGEKIPW